MDKIKENFHDLEGTIRQQRLYLNSLSVPLVSNTFVERESLAEREGILTKVDEQTNMLNNKQNKQKDGMGKTPLLPPSSK